MFLNFLNCVKLFWTALITAFSFNKKVYIFRSYSSDEESSGYPEEDGNLEEGGCLEKENELNVKLEAGYEDREHELIYEWENIPEHPSEEDTVEHEVDSIDSSEDEDSNDRKEHDTSKSRDGSERLGWGREHSSTTVEIFATRPRKLWQIHFRFQLWPVEPDRAMTHLRDAVAETWHPEGPRR